MITSVRLVAFPVVSSLAMSVALATAPVSAAPEQLWRMDGFKKPESVASSADGSALFVSNVNGEILEKDGNGYISKVSRDGKMLSEKWVEGLDAPKGLAVANQKLYVADIDQLVEIDIAEAKVLNRFPAAGAKFLNDVVAAPDGSVYVSGTQTNTIWRLSDGKLTQWLEDPALGNPNGLLIEGDQLRVAGWGNQTESGGEPGRLRTVDLKSKKIADLGSGEPGGNLDGLQSLSDGSYLITDWVAGTLYRLGEDGAVETTLEPGKGTADILFDGQRDILYVPVMLEGTLTAYRMR